MTKDVAQSVQARLLNLAKENGEDYNTLLVQYALQRFLYRLSVSKFSNQFLLKGSWLFVVWHDSLHRPTRDVDLLGFGSNDAVELLNVFVQIGEVAIDKPDGLVFDTSQFISSDIKKEGDYQGVRVKGKANLGKAVIPLQFDIGFGDAVSPKAERADLPVLLDFPSPNLRVYPVYSVIAEKFHAMLLLGLTNSRMKDFYDLLVIADSMKLSMEHLIEAVKATFDRRGMLFSERDLFVFSHEFRIDDGKSRQWEAFKRKNNLNSVDDFSEAIEKIQMFLEPVYLQIASNSMTYLDKQWSQAKWCWVGKKEVNSLK